jgi:hypothetical protein
MNWYILGSYAVTFILIFAEVMLLVKRVRETKA